MKPLFSENSTVWVFVVFVAAGAALIYSDFAPIRQFMGPDASNGPTGDASGANRTGNAIVYATDRNFQQVVVQSHVPVLVDFYADWCGPCRALGPVLEQVARETADAKIVKVNVDESPQVAGHYGIRSIPSLLVFKDGQVVQRHVGLASKQQLRALLDV